MSEPQQSVAIARRARTQTLRMRVLAIAVAIFLAAWLGLYVQLLSGRDPALANDLRPVAAQTADPQTASDGTWDDGSSAVVTADGTSQDSSSAGNGSAAAAPAVTTGQS
jgi:hypothetical protein